MELCRSLVIRNISAEDLEDARRVFRMKVYAKVSISGDPFIPAHTWKETHVDYEGGTCPTWETHFSFTIHDPSLQRNLQRLNFQFHCERLRGDKIFGEFSIPVKCLFDKVGNHNVSSSVSYPVKTASGGKQGALKFTFEFGKPLAPVVRPSRAQPPDRPQVPPGSQPPARPQVPPRSQPPARPQVPPGSQPPARPQVPPRSQPPRRPPPRSQPPRRPQVPPRSQPPRRPQVPVQLGLGVQANMNISGDCEQQGYTDIGCDGEDELACDVEQNLNISADCEQQDTPTCDVEQNLNISEDCQQQDTPACDDEDCDEDQDCDDDEDYEDDEDCDVDQDCDDDEDYEDDEDCDEDEDW